MKEKNDGNDSFVERIIVERKKINETVSPSPLVDRKIYLSSFSDRNLHRSSLSDQKLRRSSFSDQKLHRSSFSDQKLHRSSLSDQKLHRSSVSDQKLLYRSSVSDQKLLYRSSVSDHKLQTMNIPQEQPILTTSNKDSIKNLDEILALLKEILTNINSVAPKKLRSVRMGTELRELLERVNRDIENQRIKLETYVDEVSVSDALCKLKTSITNAMSLINRFHKTTFLLNRKLKEAVQFNFQEINANYTALMMTLSIAIAESSTILTIEKHLNDSKEKDEDANEEENSPGWKICLKGHNAYYGHGRSKSYIEALEYYKMASKMGCNEATLAVAEMYQYGIGTEKNVNEAMQWYETAVSNDSIEALYRIGCMLEDMGNNEELSKKKQLWALAMSKFTQAASKDHTNAQARLGHYIENGLVGFPDSSSALDWYCKAASKGNHDAQTALGSLYFRGVAVEEDYVKAVELYTLAAKQGNSTAQNNLGICYETGKGVKCDLQKASEYYRAAASTGNIRAKNNLACLLLQDCSGYNCSSSSVEAKKMEAFHLLLLASDAGVTDAQYYLGVMLEYGLAGITDHIAALRYYTKAANSIEGHTKAAASAGRMYYCGKGCKQNYTESYRYYQLGSDLNDGSSSNALGILHEEGKGCEMDNKKAMSYYLLAVEQGYKESNFNIALMLLQGGTDSHSALEYLQKAVKAKVPHADQVLKRYLSNQKGERRDSK